MVVNHMIYTVGPDYNEKRKIRANVLVISGTRCIRTF